MVFTVYLLFQLHVHSFYLSFFFVTFVLFFCVSILSGSRAHFHFLFRLPFFSPFLVFPSPPSPVFPYFSLVRQGDDDESGAAVGDDEPQGPNPEDTAKHVERTMEQVNGQASWDPRKRRCSFRVPIRYRLVRLVSSPIRSQY